jgi:hypothetical protein
MTGQTDEYQGWMICGSAKGETTHSVPPTAGTIIGAITSCIAARRIVDLAKHLHHVGGSMAVRLIGLDGGVSLRSGRA